MKKFLREVYERAPEIGGAIGATAGAAGALILDLYSRSPVPGCSGLNCPVPPAVATAVGGAAGGVVGVAAGSIVKGAPEAYDVLARQNPEAAKAGAKGAAIGAALTGAGAYASGMDPAVTAFSALYGGTFGMLLGYACQKIRETMPVHGDKK